MKSRLNNPARLSAFAFVLSLFTLVAFHKPLLELVLECVERDANGYLLIASIALLTLVVNFMVYYLLLFLGRVVGKVIIALSLLANATALYFVNTYEVLLTRDMMGNLFNTNLSEASGYLSFTNATLAEILGITQEECAALTTENAKRFFEIK